MMIYWIFLSREERNSYNRQIHDATLETNTIVKITIIIENLS